MIEGLSQNAYNFWTPDDPTKGTGKSELGKDDFLKLMIEQLKHQDPLDPMESSEYSAQLAQFTSLEQLQNMNANLENSIQADLQLAQSVNNTMSTNLIGKSVKLSNNTIFYDDQNSVSMAYELGAQAKSAQIEVKDEYGNIVKVIDLQELSAGEHKVDWDFTDGNGNKVPDGQYTMHLTAESLTDSGIVSNLYQIGTVDAIRFTDMGAVAVVGDTQYLLSEIYEIINPLG